jgi:hypothetical protein
MGLIKKCAFLNQWEFLRSYFLTPATAYPSMPLGIATRFRATKSRLMPPKKGLAFTCEASGTVVIPERLRRSEILPRRLDRRGGASVVRREAVINRMEDLNVKGCKEAVTRKI